MWDNNSRNLAARYGVALLSVGVMLAVNLALSASVLDMQVTLFLLGFGAVALSVWYGGRGPGLLATLLSGAAAYGYFLKPADLGVASSWDAEFHLTLFLLEGTTISVLGGALQRSESRKSAMLASATEAILSLDHTGRIVEFNRVAEQMFGHTPSTILGRELAELILPERLHDKLRLNLRRLIEINSGSVIVRYVEFLALRSDGSEFPVGLRLASIPAEGSLMLTAFIQDLTQQKKVGERLRFEVQVNQLNEQIKTISDPRVPFDDVMQRCLGMVCEAAGFPVGHIYWPDRSRQRLVSSTLWFLTEPDAFQTFRAITAAIPPLSYGEGLPGRIWESGHPALIENIARDDNFPQARHRSDLGIKGAFGFPILIGDDIVAVMEFFTPDELLPNEDLLNLTRNVGEQLGRVIERRRALEGQAHLAAIVDSSNDCIVGKSLEGVITTWNQAAERAYGFTAAEAIGQPISLILPPNCPELEVELLEAIRSGRRLEPFETLRQHRNGQSVLISLTLSPLWDSSGKLIGASGIERDISRQKQIERDLREAKDAAVAANRAKDEFLANVSHELRTPMNTVLGMLQLGLEEELSPVMRDYLGTAKDSADSLMFLLNDILDFSRMEAGRFKLELAPFRLRETVDGTIKTLSLRAHEKGLELACHLHPSVPEFLIGDRRRLRQVILNLVSNAIKFTERGEVVVDVSLDPAADCPAGDDPAAQPTNSENQVCLHLSVTDTGIGIAVTDQVAIFAPFKQVDASTTRMHAGTGLGLTICSELVELMGGRIWVESELGRGSQFHATLRFETAPDAPDEAMPAVALDELRALKVLVVDDNQTNRLILEKMLSNWGLRPTSVGDAGAALALLDRVQGSQEPFQLILIDALMPGQDGFQLTSEIHSAHRWPGAIILMVSSADRHVFADRLETLKIAAYLEKPVSQTNLFAAIQQALHGTPDPQPATDTRRTAPRRLRVLLVEDTPANQKVITAILDKRGHAITLAQNGREAVELVAHQSFDVVLMDIQMPTMDGLQATAAIRQQESAGPVRVPIIAMTAHALLSEQDRFIAAGMDDCLTKPIDAKMVIEMVERFGERSATAASFPTDQLAEPSPSSGHGATVTEPPTTSYETAQPVLESPILNRDAALQRMGGDVALYRELVQFFMEDAPDLLNKIRGALRDNDAQTLTRAAHSLKGQAANFDAQAAVLAAARVEEIGRSENPSAAIAALADLELQIDELLRALNNGT